MTPQQTLIVGAAFVLALMGQGTSAIAFLLTVFVGGLDDTGTILSFGAFWVAAIWQRLNRATQSG